MVWLGLRKGWGMLDEAALRAALARLLPEGASRFRAFVVADGVGRMRIGVLCTDAGFYAEVSNFGVSGTDYCTAWEGQAGVWRFCCEVDLFYSDIEQILTGSRAAAERALAVEGVEDGGEAG